MRNAVAETLYELAKTDPRICVVVADISPAGAMEKFRAEFPERFINVGVAEASMIALAAGMAQRGFKVFCYTIATFALFRCFEQIRVDLAYQNLPVTVVGMGAGLSYSTLGATHQAVEDIAVAMAMPNLTVLAPCDPAQTAECATWCAARESGGPVYMRIGKAGEPNLTSGSLPDRIHYLRRSDRGNDSIILSYGPIAQCALRAAQEIDADMAVVARLTSLDAALFRVDTYNHVVVIEEATGAPLAAQIRASGHTNVRSFALPREFCHLHGTREELLDHYGLTAEKIVAALT
jgi:transketolase